MREYVDKKEIKRKVYEINIFNNFEKEILNIIITKVVDSKNFDFVNVFVDIKVKRSEKGLKYVEWSYEFGVKDQKIGVKESRKNASKFTIDESIFLSTRITELVESYYS